jgi:hypothetical protein
MSLSTKMNSLFLVFLLSVLATSSANAVMEATGNVATLQPGANVLAASAHNDSSGSSDLSLIIQLKADDQVLVDEGSPIKAIQPLANIPSDANPTGWTQPGFDDSSWTDGAYGVGYGDGDDNTVIGDGTHATVYTRARFTVANPSAIGTLTLGVDYDDAAVVWINGVEVARTAGTDIPEQPRFDSWSDQGSGQSHEASKTDPPVYETVELSFEAGSGTAVQPQNKLTTSWARIKANY